MKYTIKQRLCVLGMALVLPACVTINIYFPAAAAEKAADKIIDEVWQIKKAQEPSSEKPDSEKLNEDKPANTQNIPASK